MAALAVLAAWPAAAHARAAGGTWLRDHAALELVVGTGGWRTALGTDARAPGFDTLAGGGELVAGFEIGAGLGVVLDGRVVAGGLGDNRYFEGLGGVAGQLRLGDRVRVRLGAAGGAASWRGDNAALVGGFLAGSFDLFPLGGGRLSLALTARLDVDSLLGTLQRLPDSSLALAIGIGLRY